MSTSYNERCDAFSYGIMIFEILFEVINPYRLLVNNDTSGSELLMGIEIRVANNPNFRPVIPKSMVHIACAHPTLIELMKKCWQHDPAARPSFQEIVNVIELEQAVMGHHARSMDGGNTVDVATGSSASSSSYRTAT